MRRGVQSRGVRSRGDADEDEGRGGSEKCEEGNARREGESGRALGGGIEREASMIRARLTSISLSLQEAYSHQSTAPPALRRSLRALSCSAGGEPCPASSARESTAGRVAADCWLSTCNGGGELRWRAERHSTIFLGTEKQSQTGGARNLSEEDKGASCRGTRDLSGWREGMSLRRAQGSVLRTGRDLYVEHGRDQSEKSAGI